MIRGKMDIKKTIKKVIDATVAVEQLLTEAREAADAERKRLEDESKRR